MVRLGFGQLATREVEQVEARGHFLGAIEEGAPEVLEALHDGMAQKAYRLLWAEWDICRDPEGWETIRAGYRKRYGDRITLAVTQDHLPHRWVSYRNAGAHEGFYPDLAPLKKHLLAWAERFHLTDEWLLNVALATLEYWRFLKKAGIEAELLEWDLNGLPDKGHWLVIQDGDRRAITIHYNPDLETWEQYVQRHLTPALKAERERLENLARERGWEPAQEKRNMEHFRWLALHQCKGWRPSRIARECLTPSRGDFGDLTNTVRDALEATAKLCGLTPRKYPRGRPSKAS